MSFNFLNYYLFFFPHFSPSHQEQRGEEWSRSCMVLVAGWDKTTTHTSILSQEPEVYCCGVNQCTNLNFIKYTKLTVFLRKISLLLDSKKINKYVTSLMNNLLIFFIWWFTLSNSSMICNLKYCSAFILREGKRMHMRRSRYIFFYLDTILIWLKRWIHMEVSC